MRLILFIDFLFCFSAAASSLHPIKHSRPDVHNPDCSGRVLKSGYHIQAETDEKDIFSWVQRKQRCQSEERARDHFFSGSVVGVLFCEYVDIFWHVDLCHWGVVWG